MHKMMILTGSDGNPRSFPPSEKVELEETYPYVLRDHFNGSRFWQLSYGNVSTLKLVSQPMGYLSHWKPDIIIVQSGMADCRPEAFTEFQQEIISKLSGRIFSRIKRYVFHPSLIKRRQVYRVPKKQFRRTLKKFKLTFPSSKIFWLEICAGTHYEESRPGLNRRMEEYNEIIKGIYGEDFVPIQKKMLEVDGFNSVDHVHWNKRGHKVTTDILLERINSYLDEKNKKVLEKI